MSTCLVADLGPPGLVAGQVSPVPAAQFIATSVSTQAISSYQSDISTSAVICSQQEQQQIEYYEQQQQQQHHHQQQQQQQQLATLTLESQRYSTPASDKSATMNEPRAGSAQDLEHLNRMREKLFRLLSKVPIRVGTVKAEASWNSRSMLTGEKRRHSSSEHLRDPLLIEYYQEKSLMSIIELHFACSLMNQCPTSRSNKINSPQTRRQSSGSIFDRATTAPYTTKMAPIRNLSNRSCGPKSMSARDKFIGQPMTMGLCRGQNNATRFIAKQRPRRAMSSTSKLMQRQQLEPASFATLCNGYDFQLHNHNQRHQDIAMLDQSASSQTHPTPQFVNQTSKMSNDQFVPRQDLQQQQQQQQQHTSFLVCDEPVSGGYTGHYVLHPDHYAGGLQAQSASAASDHHRASIFEPNQRQPYELTPGFQQQQQQHTSDQGQVPSGQQYGSIQIGHHSSPVSSYHAQPHELSQGAAHGYAAISAEFSYTPQTVQPYCSQITNAEQATTSAAATASRYPVTLAWTPPSSTPSANVTSAALDHSNQQDNSIPYQSLSQDRAPILVGGYATTCQDYPDQQQRLLPISATSNQYFTHFSISDLNLMIEQQQQQQQQHHQQQQQIHREPNFQLSIDATSTTVPNLERRSNQTTRGLSSFQELVQSSSSASSTSSSFSSSSSSSSSSASSGFSSSSVAHPPVIIPSAVSQTTPTLMSGNCLMLR